ncbi:MAG: calcium-binding protein, partial [Syntrophorhabdaceae bacterium]|nr:calcium-binding protein [Syntrophorhabdaceae bacterium]
AGNDVLYGDEGNDALMAGTGNDAVYGGTGDDALWGEAGNDLLDGGTGADRIAGGTGNDMYYVDNAGDIVTEAVNEGTDTVFSSISYTLPANVENLTLTGTLPINGTGNGLDNVLTGNASTNILTGNAGNDTIDGREGADTMTGGSGNDTFFVDNTGDTVTEAVNEGTDTVNSSASYILGANIENLTLIGNDAISGTGNALDNIMIGNSAANILDGGLGADTMTGGLGDDTYMVDNSGDVVTEGTNEGVDTAVSSINYTLSDNIENLTLAGTDSINGTGNNLGNIITGNSAANILTGLAGNDILDGGAGNDTLIGGSDTDTMYGGSGNDTFFVDNTGDVIAEYADEGTDTVYSSITYTLTANVENLTLTGNDEIDGSGNSLDNIITGNDADNMLYGKEGNDTLIGGAGADRMSGGTGDDTYYVDNAGDYVKEKTNEGVDTVYSSISYILTDNVENLTLVGGPGTTASAGIGNDLDNIITGNDMNNYLMGGAGGDTYKFSIGNGSDIVNDAGLDGASDRILFTDTVSRETIAFFQDDTILHISYGNTDHITVLNQDTTGIEKVQLSNDLFLTDSDINLLIQQMTAYANSNGISLTTVDDVKNNQELMGMVVSAWHQ